MCGIATSFVKCYVNLQGIDYPQYTLVKLYFLQKHI